MAPLRKTSVEANGGAIRALRDLLGYPLGEFAVLCGTTHPHLSNIEAGRKYPSAALLRRIADNLGVPLHILRGDPSKLPELEEAS